METLVETKAADDHSEMGDNVNIVSVKGDTKIPNKDIESKLPSESAPSRKNMKEEKARKKDDRSVEQVLKALNSLDTTEEKLAAMCKKYADTVDENRKLQLSLKQTEKRLIVLQREKEQLQTEHSKAVLTRSRLESLCRELQRQNKAVKDESLLKIREEEEKRKEVSAKFQSTLADVTALMQQNNEKNCKLREDNLEMTKKFKSVCEQYELREQQVEKISKQLQLESQLADAKLSKAKMEMTAEKETLLREKQQLLLEVVECQAKIQDLQATETSLRSQISLYTNKYDEFQNALSRSNDVFEGFKGEMEKMSKKICKLEKETSSWKQRWEKSHQALLEMAADKQQRDSELQLTTRQLAQLQKLCRTLQAERTSLLAQLKATVPVKPNIVEEVTQENGEKRQGDDKDSCCLPNLESALSEAEATPVQPSETVQQNGCMLKALSELAKQAVPKTDAQNPEPASEAQVHLPVMSDTQPVVQPGETAASGNIDPITAAGDNCIAEPVAAQCATPQAETAASDQPSGNTDPTAVAGDITIQPSPAINSEQPENPEPCSTGPSDVSSAELMATPSSPAADLTPSADTAQPVDLSEVLSTENKLVEPAVVQTVEPNSPDSPGSEETSPKKPATSPKKNKGGDGELA